MLGGKRGGFVREDNHEPSFQIRPSFEKKFRPGAVKETIHQILDETLAGKTYDTGKVADWSKDIADQIKGRIKEMGYDRYKVYFRNKMVMFAIGMFIFYNRILIYIKTFKLLQLHYRL